MLAAFYFGVIFFKQILFLLQPDAVLNLEVVIT